MTGAMVYIFPSQKEIYLNNNQRGKKEGITKNRGVMNEWILYHDAN